MNGILENGKLFSVFLPLLNILFELQGRSKIQKPENLKHFNGELIEFVHCESSFHTMAFVTKQISSRD